jgi:hypothetical protein
MRPMLSVNPDKTLNITYPYLLRMRESYKRFVKTWIGFANPWIRIILWSRILTLKRFHSCLTKQILDS